MAGAGAVEELWGKADGVLEDYAGKAERSSSPHIEKVKNGLGHLEEVHEKVKDKSKELRDATFDALGIASQDDLEKLKEHLKKSK